MKQSTSLKKVDPPLEPITDPEIDNIAIGLCADYLAMYKEASLKEQEKEGKKTAMVIGIEVGKEWAETVRARLADKKDLGGKFYEGRLSTAVHEHAGHPKLFDFRLIGARREVCFEVQTSGSGPHKPAQKQAQDLYVREVASGPVYKYTITASEIPRLERARRDGPARDLSSRLGAHLK